MTIEITAPKSQIEILSKYRAFAVLTGARIGVRDAEKASDGDIKTVFEICSKPVSGDNPLSTRQDVMMACEKIFEEAIEHIKLNGGDETISVPFIDKDGQGTPITQFTDDQIYHLCQNMAAQAKGSILDQASVPNSPTQQGAKLETV